MPYLGQSPKETFSAATSQVITGNGGTSYSLSKAVSSPEDLEVFINNVQQQPTTTYTVSGTTITFDEALNSTDTCYVIFRGSTKESRVHPAGSSLTAANITASGNATVTGDLTVDTNTLKVDSSNNRIGVGTTSPDGSLHVKGMSDHGRIIVESGGTTGSSNNTFIQFHNDGGTEVSQITVEEAATNQGQMVFKTGGTTTAMTLTKEGAISTPLQPLAEAYYNSSAQDGAYGATNRNYVVCKPGATHVNVGNMYNPSTGRFTVTVPGRYLAFVAGSQYNINVTGYWYVYIRKNNSIQKYIYNSLTGATWETLAGFTTFDMANGDFIDFYNQHDSATNTDRGGWDINNYTKFLVYKLL